MKISVTNLPKSVTEQILADSFSQVGTVVSCSLEDGKGTVEMSSEDEAKCAVDQFNGVEHDGKVLECSFL